MVHPGVIENYHPGDHEKFHPSAHYVIEHDGRLKKSWYSALCCGTLRKPRYTCCRRRAGKEGCRKKWACCKTAWDKADAGCQLRHNCCGALVNIAGRAGCSPRYQCCLAQVNSEGCTKVCKKCGADWGSPALTCFRKEHVLVDIDAPDKAAEAGGGGNTGADQATPPTDCDAIGLSEHDPFLVAAEIPALTKQRRRLIVTLSGSP